MGNYSIANMTREQAIGLLNGFINLHTLPYKDDPVENCRELYHHALSVLENQ